MIRASWAGPLAAFFLLSFLRTSCGVSNVHLHGDHTDHVGSSFLQSRGVFTGADGMEELNADGGGFTPDGAIISQVNAYPEEAPLVSRSVASLATKIATSSAIVHASASPPPQQAIAAQTNSLPWPLSAMLPGAPAEPTVPMTLSDSPVPPVHLLALPRAAGRSLHQNELVEASPPASDTKELPPLETDDSGPGNGEDRNDLLATPRKVTARGEREAVTLEGEFEYGLRPTQMTSAPRALAHFPTNAPGTVHVKAKALRGRDKAAPLGMPRDVLQTLAATANQHELKPYPPVRETRMPWRAADWGVPPSALRPRSALTRISSRVRKDDPLDTRFAPPSAYINTLMPEWGKMKSPLSPSVVSRPKGWDQCLRFVRDVKARGVVGGELVKVFKGTCLPAVRAHQATERFSLMCNSIGGALEPFTAQLDYKPNDVCNAVLVIFHDVNAVDAKQ